MPWNGNGVFSRLFNWENDQTNGIDILSSRMDQDTDDIATGLMHCLTVNGETVPTAALNMNNFQIHNVGNAQAAQDAVTYNQIANGSIAMSGLSISGNISVGGQAIIAGALSVEAQITTPEISINGLIVEDSGGYLYSSAPIECPYLNVSGLFLENSGGVLYTPNAFQAAGNTQIGGTLTVSGSASFAAVAMSGTLGVTGDITTSNDVNIGGQGVRYQAYQGNVAVALGYNTSNGALQAYVNGSYLGVIQITACDARLKRDIQPSSVNALAVLDRVALYAYDRMFEAVPEVVQQHHEIGFVAQQLRQVIPEAVTEGLARGADEPLLGLDLMPLLAYAVRAIQQLSARVRQLEAGV